MLLTLVVYWFAPACFQRVSHLSRKEASVPWSVRACNLDKYSQPPSTGTSLPPPQFHCGWREKGTHAEVNTLYGRFPFSFYPDPTTAAAAVVRTLRVEFPVCLRDDLFKGCFREITTVLPGTRGI